MRSCFKLLFVLVLACGPKAVFAHDAPPYPNCETRLMLQERMTQKLGYTPLFDTSIMKPFTKMEGARRFMITAKHPRFGMVLAFLDYTSYDEGQTLDLDKVDVLNDNNFAKGLSNALFAEMMAQNPESQKLMVSLSDVNRRALLKALETASSCAEAFQQTPMYKAAAHYGFTKISGECNQSNREYKFVMEREPLH